MSLKGWEHFGKTISARIDRFAEEAEKMPGVVILHEVGDFPVIYMSSYGLRLLNISLPELQQLATEYHSRYFNIDDLEDFIPKFRKLLESRDPQANFSYLQQVKLAGAQHWALYLSCTRIFAFDEQNNPIITATVAVPVHEMKHMPQKAERLLHENEFLRRHFKEFSTLGDREKEVLKWVALGCSSPEIAEKMFIAPETVNTHRKNIKRKLGISTVFQFNEYARAFDLY